MCKGDVMDDAVFGCLLMGAGVVLMGAIFSYEFTRKRIWVLRPNLTLGGIAFFMYYEGVLMIHTTWIETQIPFSNFSYGIATILALLFGTFIARWMWYGLFKASNLIVKWCDELPTLSD